MTFKEISAWIETAAIVALYGYYIVEVPHAATAGAALGLYVGVAVAFIALVVVLNIAAAIMHRPENEDERDRLIAAKASRNAYFVLMTGTFGAILLLLVPDASLSQFTHLPQSMMAAHLLVLSIAAGELLRFTSQVLYYRLGA